MGLFGWGKKKKNSEDSTEDIKKLQEENKKLKKEKESLEDELDDLQDDYDDAKKDLSEQKEKNENLKKDNSELEKESKASVEKLNQTQKKLEAQERSIQSKNEAIDFIKEILSAKENLDSDYSELYKNIDGALSYLNDEFKSSLKNIGSSDDNTNNILDDADKWALISKKTWLKNKTAVAFVGEFSAGKTSIVNKLLDDGGSKLNLPTSMKATTAIPTYIAGGDNVSFRFFTPDNKLKGISEKTFMKVSKEVLSEIDGIQNLIKYFVMTVKNPKLNNLSILDTPGFSSNDKEDEARTLETVNECDALFWVIDVQAGDANKKSLETIKRNLKRPLYVIISKTDTKSKGEIDSVEKKLNETFSRAGISVEKFIRFSHKEDSTELVKVLQSIQPSNVNNFKDKLSDYIKLLNDEMEKEYNENLNKYNTLKSDYANCVEKIESILNTMRENCVNAHNNFIDMYGKFTKDGLKASGFLGLGEGQYKVPWSVAYQIKESMGDSLKSLKEIVGYKNNENIDVEGLISELENSIVKLIDTVGDLESLNLDGIKKRNEYFKEISSSMKRKIDKVERRN